MWSIIHCQTKGSTFRQSWPSRTQRAGYAHLSRVELRSTLTRILDENIYIITSTSPQVLVMTSLVQSALDYRSPVCRPAPVPSQPVDGNRAICAAHVLVLGGAAL
jgi:hypothetical protein